ncbi:cell wall hydrolase/autolysin [Desulfotomaculum nigrificans CO-1-SRB]|uniref:Cell wall hydrolase/autolysin n=1 Tax=Desulfotomaculum nigrificans (strain DSM 14880 / VKM B-2319 / CO-1-SRB) TaxID=868595 RepID=F6B6E1_DESCC|nr:N-acetylmuramoyl-L-alanine amidase [Desulfotomaculum nigrificans]AEF93212.1 cell wall hydrolase/autolysin [Desulfotomaculum nigrificans CO-1-SRB]
MSLRIILMAALVVFPNLCWAGNVAGRVVIDPGHGGYDPGACRKGVTEKQINLEIAKELKKILQDKKVEVLLTREGDYNHAIIGLHGKEAKRYDFERRIELAKNFNADAMVSIHVNVGRIRCSGPEVFYYQKSVQGKFLAEHIQKELHQIPGIHRRVVKTGSYYLLTHTDMPCVIVETGFINNSAERKKLLDPKYRRLLAEAIARGIVNYLQEKDKNIKEDVKVLNDLRVFWSNLQKKVS